MYRCPPHRAQTNHNARTNQARSPNSLENHFCHYLNTLIDSICRTTTATDILTRSQKPIAREAELSRRESADRLIRKTWQFSRDRITSNTLDTPQPSGVGIL